MADANLNIRLTVKDDGSTAIDGVSRRLVNLEARASTTARRVSTAWKRAGAAVVGALSVQQVARAARGAVAYGDSIAKVADKVGVASSALQEYRFAAERAGVGANTLDMALQRFSRRLGEAVQGKGELREVLEQYGIAVTDAAGRTRATEAVLDDMADAIAGASSEQERLRLAFKAFDSEGAAMVNALKDGSAGLNDMRQRARDLGLVLGDDLLRTAVEVEDQLTDLSNVVKTKLAHTFLGAMPGLLNFARTVGLHYDVWAAGMVTSVMKVTAVAEELVEGVKRQWDRLTFGKDELGFFRIGFEEEAFDPLPMRRRLEIIEADHTRTVEAIRAQWQALSREQPPAQNSTLTFTKTVEDGGGLWHDPTEGAEQWGELRARAEWQAYARAMGQLRDSSQADGPLWIDPKENAAAFAATQKHINELGDNARYAAGTAANSFRTAFATILEGSKNTAGMMTHLFRQAAIDIAAEFAKRGMMRFIGSVVGAIAGSYGGPAGSAAGAQAGSYVGDQFASFHDGATSVAPRAHGGWNLAGDEVPAILQTRERVVSREQNRDLTDFLARERGSGGGGDIYLDGAKVGRVLLRAARQGRIRDGRDTFALVGG